MTLRECYLQLGGDYDTAMSYLRTEERVGKFLAKFLNEGSYALLLSSLEQGDMEVAFRAAHTLKGVCQNLFLTQLHHSSAELTEALRGGLHGDISALLSQVTQDYTQTIDAIRAWAQP